MRFGLSMLRHASGMERAFRNGHVERRQRAPIEASGRASTLAHHCGERGRQRTLDRTPCGFTAKLKVAICVAGAHQGDWLAELAGARVRP
jgi:hypothetical protein